jgi:23S rRNA pseudouridine2605 synthase
MIAQGLVAVNGVTVDEVGKEVDPEKDSITVEGKPLQHPSKIYILLNKPAGYISSVADQHGRKTVLQLVPEVKERVYPVGRLDFDTEGLIILTNDGDFANLMTHPRYGVSKVYHALVQGRPTDNDLKPLCSGIVLEGGQTAPARVRIVKTMPREALVELELREGRKRQVKEMMKAVGFPVLKLKRIRFSFLSLKGIAPGEYRYLSPDEVARLVKEANEGSVYSSRRH